MMIFQLAFIALPVFTLGRQIPNSAELQFNLTHCYAQDGSALAIGEIHKRTQFWFRCVNDKEGFFPYLKRSGCMDQSGQMINDGESYKGSQFVYKCTVIENDGSIERRPTACLDDNENEVADGAKFVRGSYLYMCNIAATTPRNDNRLIMVACIGNNGQQLRVGETEIRSGYFYECKQLSPGVLQLAVAGCVDGDGNKVNVGGSFLRPPRDEYQYRSYCIRDDATGKVSTECRSCRYSGNGNNIEIKTGCYYPVTTVGAAQYFACKQWKKQGTVIISFTEYIEELANLRTGPECLVQQL